MLKKHAVFSWTKEGKQSFEEIKKALSEAPTLANPNFDRDFILYAYGSYDCISTVLVQENEDGFEQPIAFLVKDFMIMSTVILLWRNTC